MNHSGDVARESRSGERKERPTLRLEGEEEFPLSRPRLWGHLTDMECLSRSIPDLESVSRSEPGLLVCRVRPGFSFLRGSLEVHFEITDQQAPERAQMRVTSRGIGSSVCVRLEIELIDPAAGGPDADSASGVTGRTRLRWAADIEELGGLLKPVSHDLIRAAAGRLVAQIWSNVRRQLPAN